VWKVLFSMRSEVTRLGAKMPLAEQLRLLDDVLAADDPRAAPHLLYAMIEGRLPEHETTRTIGSLLANAPSLVLLRLEQEMRTASEPPEWTNPGRQLEALAKFATSPSHWGIQALATLDRSGYARESAVRTLARISQGGQENPYLLLRTQDWVSQVKSAAVAAVSARLLPNYAAAWVSALPLVMHLARLRSRAERSVVDSVLKLLGSTDARPALLAGVTSRDVYVRRECFSFAVSVGHPVPHLVSAAILDNDSLIRLWGVQQLKRNEGLSEASAFARSTLHDSFAPVRRTALEVLARVEGQHAGPEFSAALLDGTASIRAQARQSLARWGFFGFPEVYRGALGKPRRQVPAILGLGEVGASEDAADLLRFLEDPRPRLREAAARSIALLLNTEAIPALLELLTDASRRVSRTAYRLLTRHLNGEIAARAWHLAESAPPSRALSAVNLLSQLPKWEALEYLLRASALPKPVQTEAVRLLQKWLRDYPKSQRQLSQAEAGKLSAMFRESASPLPPEIRAHLASILEFWRTL